MHVLGNAVLFAMFCGLGYWFSRRRVRARIGLSLSILMGAMGTLVIAYPDLLTLVLPFADIVFYSELFPFAVAFFIPCALALTHSRWQRVRVGVLCVLLLGASFYDFRRYLLPPAPTGEPVIDENGICRQTGHDTCGAAAAVTLLRLHGIHTTEQEVARLALTKKGVGTRHLGLYRAVKILVAPRPDLVVRLRRISANRLLEINRPCIITVGLPQRIGSQAEIDLATRYQWTPGVTHDVVFLGINKSDDTKADIAEPDFGLEDWPISHLRVLFHDFALYVEGRQR